MEQTVLANISNTTSENNLCRREWDRYIKVTYQGFCHKGELFIPPPYSYVRACLSLVLSILGTFFNLWGLLLLLLDYRSAPAKKTHYNSQYKTSGLNTSKISHCSSRRTTMQVGLIIFCFFEVFYHAASSSEIVVHIYSNIQVNRTNFPKPSETDGLTYIFSILPSLTSIACIIRDAGICGRNWAITLITISRAQAVTWPLQSRFYQRFLREKKYFLIIFSFFALYCSIISVLKHLDQELFVCYDPKFESYCLSTKDFLTYDFNRFSAMYFSFQTFIPWLLILVFTSLIIYRLKPCRRHAENSILRSKNKASGRDNNLRASITVTVIATFFTIFEFPTFALSMVYIAQPYLADKLAAWDTLANTFLQIDSITNFFLLIITMPSLRRRLRKTFLRSKLHEETPVNEPRTVVDDAEVDDNGRS